MLNGTIYAATLINAREPHRLLSLKLGHPLVFGIRTDKINCFEPWSERVHLGSYFGGGDGDVFSRAVTYTAKAARGFHWCQNVRSVLLGVSERREIWGCIIQPALLQPSEFFRLSVVNKGSFVPQQGGTQNIPHRRSAVE